MGWRGRKEGGEADREKRIKGRVVKMVDKGSKRRGNKGRRN